MFGLLTLGACTFIPEEWKDLFERQAEQEVDEDEGLSGEVAPEPEPEPATPPLTDIAEPCGTACPIDSGRYDFVGYVALTGTATVDPDAHTYTGNDHYAVRAFADESYPAIDEFTTRCDIEWAIADSGPAAEPCEDCTWSLTVTLGDGTETTAGACETLVDIDDAFARTGFTIGYYPTFEFVDPTTGTTSTFPVLMHHDGTDWTAVSDLVEYDPESGGFTYTWIKGIYYF